MPSAPDDDDYNSASDSDFNDAELSASSAEEDSDGEEEAVSKGRKAKGGKKDVDGDVEMASGDEGIVAQGRRKKTKKKTKGKVQGKGKGNKGGEEEDVDDEDEEDDTPVGVRVRLRSGRGGQEAKKADIPTISAATVDIDAIWARMNNPAASNPPPPPVDPPDEEQEADAVTIPPPLLPTTEETAPPSAPVHSHTEPTITIPHTYTFAGQLHTSTKTVPVSSPAARAYLSSIEKSTSQTTAAATNPANLPSGPTLRRPLARKGLLEPNPSRQLNSRSNPLPARTDLPSSIGGSRTPTTTTGTSSSEKAGISKGKENKNSNSSKKLAEKAEKLNTVEKSKLDWEAEVERAGMREELEKAEKSGGSYLGRVEFLRRVEGEGEERARVARLKTKGLL